MTTLSVKRCASYSRSRPAADGGQFLAVGREANLVHRVAGIDKDLRLVGMQAAEVMPFEAAQIGLARGGVLASQRFQGVRDIALGGRFSGVEQIVGIRLLGHVERGAGLGLLVCSSQPLVGLPHQVLRAGESIGIVEEAERQSHGGGGQGQERQQRRVLVEPPRECSAGASGRALVGRPARNRCRSSARSAAAAYRCEGDFCRHLATIAPRSVGTSETSRWTSMGSSIKTLRRVSMVELPSIGTRPLSS